MRIRAILVRSSLYVHTIRSTASPPSVDNTPQLPAACMSVDDAHPPLQLGPQLVLGLRQSSCKGQTECWICQTVIWLCKSQASTRFLLSDQ